MSHYIEARRREFKYLNIRFQLSFQLINAR